MRQVILLFSLLSAFQVFAQNTFKLTGKITDAETGQPLVRATIKDTSRLLIYYSGDSGIFSMRLTLPAELTISYLGYETKVIKLKTETSDTLSIQLTPSEAALKEVEVLPELPKYLFYGSRETQVIDYEFWGDKTLIAVYNYMRKRCYLILLDRYNNVIDEQPVPSDFESFYKSGIDKYYAVTTNSIFELYPQHSRIGIKPVSRELFYSKIIYYKAWHGQYLYICELSKNKQAATFYIEDTTLHSGSYEAFSIVGDRRQYGKASRMKTGMDKARANEMAKVFYNYNPVAEGDFLEDFDAFETRQLFMSHTLYTKTYLDRPVYTPLFTNDSCVLIFDFYENRLNQYSFDAKLKNIIPVSFQRKEGWVPWVYKTGDLYFTAYMNNDACSVTTLDNRHWGTGKMVMLYYSKISDLKVRGNYIYYLHQPGNRSNNVFLFREKWAE